MSIDNELLNWLLEPQEIGVRYLAMRDLCHLPEDDPEMRAARLDAHQHGPIAHILEKMNPQGSWELPGPGYSPKYRSTVWSIILLAQLGASVEADPRIRTACEYLMNHTYAQGGYFSHSGAPSGTFDCLQGNLCWSLTSLGYEDPRLLDAYEWMAKSQVGEGIASQKEKKAALRYYSAKCGPNFACGANYNLPCAWGAAKVILAFGNLPPAQRSDLVQRAIQLGADFIFSVDPLTAAWPTHDTISRNWWKFGFPVFYITDLLQVAEAMTAVGFGRDPRLASLIQFIRDKRDSGGKWLLEYDYQGKTWGNYGVKDQPNKWVTLRALRVLDKLEKQASLE